MKKYELNKYPVEPQFQEKSSSQKMKILIYLRVFKYYLKLKGKSQILVQPARPCHRWWRHSTESYS